MRGFRFTLVVTFLFLIIFSNHEMAMGAMDKGYLEMGGYSERSEIDINETHDPLIFNGWLNYTGISVVPLKVYLNAYADLGELELTESEFVFHIPSNETFVVHIYIDTIKGNQSRCMLTLYTYIEQGPTTGTGPSMRMDHLVINSSKEEDISVVSKNSPKNDDAQGFGYLGIISMLIIIYSFIRRKVNNPKRKYSNKR